MIYPHVKEQMDGGIEYKVLLCYYMGIRHKQEIKFFAGGRYITHDTIVTV